jgi:chromate reductase, NAD(P)H dehydrogenase (quinone)
MIMTTTGNILAISGSLRAGSLNTEVLRACALLAPRSVSVTMFDGLATLPAFNPDLDVANQVLPPSVQEFRRQIGEADAVLISSPEYAHGVPGSLKNALDWLVASSEMLYKPIGLLNISPRSSHAYASLLETLRTMSTLIVPEALVEFPLTRSMVDAQRIAANPEIADRLQSALLALSIAGPDYRLRGADWRSFGTVLR